MRKEYKEFFKNESKFYVFVLLHTVEKSRNDLLGVTYSLFTSKKRAENWYNNILETIKEENNKEAEEKLKDIYEYIIR